MPKHDFTGVLFFYCEMFGTLVSPLANPKGVKHQCELCGKPAYVQCSDCRVVYYCDAEHEKLDRFAIHQKICGLIRDLRTMASSVYDGTEEEKYEKLAALKTKQVGTINRFAWRLVSDLSRRCSS